MYFLWNEKKNSYTYWDILKQALSALYNDYSNTIKFISVLFIQLRITTEFISGQFSYRAGLDHSLFYKCIEKSDLDT